MKVLAVLALLAIAACAAAQPTPPDLWRMDTTHLAHDRALARACLDDEGREDCTPLIQYSCLVSIPEEGRTPAAQRACDWRAIAAWEDEMNTTLAAMRSSLPTEDLRRLEASQQAWSASMLADVALGMDHYEGGALAGPVGAEIRARATAQRASYLDRMWRMLGGE